MLDTILLTLLEAQITLYATPDGTTLGNPIWSGQVARGLAVREKWITVETRPSGARNPIQHPLVAQYEINIDRVWALPLGNLTGFQPTGQTYILDVVWTLDPLSGEVAGGSWHRRTFYGVTISERSFAPQSIETEFADGQTFLAQYFVAGSGAVGTIPAPVVARPLWVQWVSPADGAMPLYNYANGLYTETVAGQAASRATIAADGSSITFAAGSVVALQTTANGVTVPQLHDTYPQYVPQLQFFQGANLLGVVTPWGVWARTIADGGVTAGGFGLAYQGTLVGSFTAGLAEALAWTATA